MPLPPCLVTENTLTIFAVYAKITTIFMKKSKFRLSVWQFLAIGYLIVIIVGSVLLILPFATIKGEHTSYIGALFTATSATCVTGLSPYATGTHWTLYGQIVILLLIQLGGLGFMTIVSSLLMLFGRGMGIGSRRALMTSAGSDKLFGLKSLVRRIVIGSAIFETLGAVLLSLQFVPDFGWAKGIYYSVFHSVSAFCNAGFDLLATIGSSSLSSYATNPLVSLTICGLIIIGGLGFCVWSDVIRCRLRFSKFQFNTKVILVTTFILLIVPTFMFLGLEWSNPSYEGYNFWQKLLLSFFSATTPRTAGFFTTHPSSLSDSAYLLTIILMFIGGSSGSTAGGLKVGTFAVIVMGMVGVFRGQRDINIGKKRIEYSLLSQALAILVACLMFVMLATLAICAIEPAEVANFQTVLYECVSAMGTVGLSMDLTPHLSIYSLIILIILMYAGRVGILTLALALAKKRKTPDVRYPVDTLLIG